MMVAAAMTILYCLSDPIHSLTSKPLMTMASTTPFLSAFAISMSKTHPPRIFLSWTASSYEEFLFIYPCIIKSSFKCSRYRYNTLEILGIHEFEILRTSLQCYGNGKCQRIPRSVLQDCSVVIQPRHHKMPLLQV